MKSQSTASKVRDYLTANPTASSEEVIKKLGISKQYLYVLRSQMRKSVKRKPKAAPVPVEAVTISEPVTDPAALSVVMYEPTEDLVNNPAHYTFGGIETIDFIEAKKLDYLLGNAVKYISRAGKKDPADSLTDLRKAQWYLKRAVEKRENA